MRSSFIMGWLLSAVIFLAILQGTLCIQVVVPEQQRSTSLFASVILRCDYSTSASLQDVVITWTYKEFCKDPVLEYYSTAYQSALQLGQDPSIDCQDGSRKVRTVVQKRGGGEPILGSEYRERKITIQNKADLVINEVMWWDHGVYYCSVSAVGDTTGDPDKEIKLIVYHWLTVLFIIIGALLLLLLFCICCCQCCPQKCCCYVRCPCCPQKCCCPEKAIMRHRLLKQTEMALKHGQPYIPMSQMSSQMNPMLYAGSVAGQSMPMKPMPLPPPHSTSYSVPAPSVQGSHAPSNNAHMLNYLENQVRGMDVASPLLQPPPSHHMNQMPPPPQYNPIQVPYSQGPPSMISALDDGVQERRIITLPPIREQRVPPPAPNTRPPSSSESSRSGFTRRDDRGANGRRYPSPPRSRGIPRSYSEESLDGRSRGRPRAGMDRPRSRSRDDLFDSRSRGNYSPPAARRSRGGSFSSDEEIRGGKGGRGWTEFEPGQKPGARRSDQYSDKNIRRGNSIVI